MPDLHQAPSRARLVLALLAGAILIGVAGGYAQAENGQEQAAAGATEASVSGQPGGEAETSVANEPIAEAQKLLCMWRNKGVTGFCDVEPEAAAGTSCACRAVIEHRARKFTGKVIVSR
jgi:hypothetical protein